MQIHLHSVQYIRMFNNTEHQYWLNDWESGMNVTSTADILERACKMVQKHAELRFGPFTQAPGPRHEFPDGLIDIEHEGKSQQYAVEIKPLLHSAGIPHLGQRVAESDKPLLVVTASVTSAQGRALKTAGIQFMDTAGNCWLDLPRLCLLVLGNKGEIEVRPASRRGLSAAAVRLVFHCLADPTGGFLNRPYREIADLTGVSLGSVTSIRATLYSMGFLNQSETGIGLSKRRDLLERWVVAYGDRVRPKLIVGRYRASVQDWWKSVSLDPSVALWGGEVAGARLTGYLKPEIVSIYRFSGLNHLILKHDLRMDPGGNVEILDAFWRSSDLRDGDCVHPLLAYADLLSSDSDRNVETARMLYEQRLRKLVEGD